MSSWPAGASPPGTWLCDGLLSLSEPSRSGNGSVGTFGNGRPWQSGPRPVSPYTGLSPLS